MKKKTRTDRYYVWSETDKSLHIYEQPLFFSREYSEWLDDDSPNGAAYVNTSKPEDLHGVAIPTDKECELFEPPLLLVGIKFDIYAECEDDFYEGRTRRILELNRWPL